MTTCELIQRWHPAIIMDILKGQKTTYPIAEQLSSDWVLVDANEKILGRLATQIAQILQGKNKAAYMPGTLVGDSVVIINAAGVKMTGKKLQQKEIKWYTGYDGGLKSRTVAKQMEIAPEKVIEKAIKGMLPKTKHGRALMRRLRIFAGAEHNLQSQQPKAI